MSEKIRIQVGLSADLVARLDRLSDDVGMTRSAYAAFLIGEGVQNRETALGAIQDVADTLKSLASSDAKFGK